RRGPAADRGRPRRRRRVLREGGSLRRRPHLRGPPHHVNNRAREELVGIGALVIGLFLGLTLAPWHVTGNIGSAVGDGLWKAFGVGSIVIPVLGIGWALAAFGRLGSVSSPRAAILGAGLIVLLPYAVAVVSGVVVDSRADYTHWTTPQRLIGVMPAALADLMIRWTGPVGAAGVGLFALSALGVFTIGWHTLAMLRAKREEEAKTPKREPRPKPTAPSIDVDHDEQSFKAPPTLSAPRASKDKKAKPAPKPVPKPAPPLPAPQGLIPPIDLLNKPPAEAADVGIA